MRDRLGLGGSIAMNREQRAHDFGRAAAGHTAFGGDAEIGNIFYGGGDALVGGRDPIVVDQAEEELRIG